jgi:hypothetical protein
MVSRTLARPAAWAVLALLSTSAIGANASPPIPPVAEIPVAPPASPSRRIVATAPSPALTTTTTTTTTTVAPPLAAVMVEPAPASRGVVEAMPAPPAPAGAPHVVIVDELPFRATHERARELPEHAEHSRHGKKHGRHGRPFHPAPGIVVDVTDASGGASAVDLQRTARNVGYWPFRHCYEEGLRRDQKMTGKVSLDLTVAPGGNVDAATIAGSTLHDESVVLCVAREAQHLALASGESSAAAKLSVTLATGDEPVPMPRPAPHAEDLREGLRASWPAVQQCYASELSKHPDAGGRLELKFRVRSGGELSEVAEGDSRFGDVDLTRCVLGVYRTAKLTGVGHASHEGTFVYPIHLEARPPRPAVVASAAMIAPRTVAP